MEKLINAIHESNYTTVHTSDILRIAILWKSGGTYLDSDMIALREFPNDTLAPNFICQVADSGDPNPKNFSEFTI